MTLLRSFTLCENGVLKFFLRHCSPTNFVSPANDAPNHFCPVASAATLWSMTWQQAHQGATVILQRCWTQNACPASRELLFPVLGHCTAEGGRFHHAGSHIGCLSSARQKVAITRIHILPLLLPQFGKNVSKIEHSSESGSFVNMTERGDWRLELRMPRNWWLRPTVMSSAYVAYCSQFCTVIAGQRSPFSPHVRFHMKARSFKSTVYRVASWPKTLCNFSDQRHIWRATLVIVCDLKKDGLHLVELALELQSFYCKLLDQLQYYFWEIHTAAKP